LDSDSEIINSTSILLLANPAHQTALNTRKRLISCGVRDVRTELRFTAALLSLRESSKQSILWHHRRWLLRKLGTCPHTESGSDTMDEDDLRGYDIPVESLTMELEIVSRACEIYPRNYFAWNHRFRCIDALNSTLRNIRLSHSQPDTVTGGGGGVAIANANAHIIVQECASAKDWISRHISDYTAMQYFLRLLTSRIRRSDLRELQAVDGLLEAETETETVERHALELVRMYPDHEALWIYLRGAIAARAGSSPPRVMDMDDESVLELLAVARRYLLSERLDDDDTSESGQGGLGGVTKRQAEHVNAYRFIVWISREHGELRLAHGWEPRKLLSAGYGSGAMSKWTLQD